MNSTINKVLFLQLSQLLKKQGLKALLAFLIYAFNHRVLNKYFRGSFSQKGEDLEVDKYFNHKKRGFYVDVGASHPERFSNTNYLYQKGWRGINIEPHPTRIKLFSSARKRDINLNVGVSNKEGVAIFYEFEAGSLSTFSKKEADTLLKVGYKLMKKSKIKVYKLNTIFKKYVKSEIDFMTIDTEGLDMEVLKSNDWKIFRPKLLCVETVDFIDLLTGSSKVSKRKEVISIYLLSKGYSECLSNGLNTIYEDMKQISNKSLL